MRENGTINSDLAISVTGLKISRIKQIFKNLREDEVIIAEGSNKNRTYKLKQ